MGILIVKPFKQILIPGAESRDWCSKKAFDQNGLRHDMKRQLENGCVESFLCLVVIKCLCEQEMLAYTTVNDLESTKNWIRQIFRNTKCDRIG